MWCHLQQIVLCDNTDQDVVHAYCNSPGAVEELKASEEASGG